MEKKSMKCPKKVRDVHQRETVINLFLLPDKKETNAMLVAFFSNF